MSRSALILLICLAALLIGGLGWYSNAQAEQARQRSYAAAKEARSAAQTSIEAGDILGYEQHLRTLEVLEKFPGRIVDGQDLAQTGAAWRKEAELLAVAALPRFHTALVANPNGDQFGAFGRLLMLLDAEANRHWRAVLLPVCEQIYPESALEERRSVRYHARKVLREQVVKTLDEASAEESYTLAIVAGDQAMKENGEHFEQIHESIFMELNARFAPTALLPRKEKGRQGGKGHIDAVVTAEYAIYTGTTPLEQSIGPMSAPERLTVTITVSPTAGTSFVRTVQVEKLAARPTRFVDVVHRRWVQYYWLEEQIEQGIRAMNFP